MSDEQMKRSIFHRRAFWLCAVPVVLVVAVLGTVLVVRLFSPDHPRALPDAEEEKVIEELIRVSRRLAREDSPLILEFIKEGALPSKWPCGRYEYNVLDSRLGVFSLTANRNDFTARAETVVGGRSVTVSLYRGTYEIGTRSDTVLDRDTDSGPPHQE